MTSRQHAEALPHAARTPDDSARRTTPRASWSSPARLGEAAVVVVALVAFVAVVAPSLDQPLLERHKFRQTQTAFTARIYHEDGIDLLHPKTPVLGAPFEIPYEFPLFQAVASLVMDTGVRDDVAMRATALTCFLLTALLLFGLVRHVAGRACAIPALVAFVATPFSLLWGRASMIEYLATAGAVGFAWGTIAYRDSGRRPTAAVALLAGVVGMLVKPTTAIFWLIPALAYRPGERRDDMVSARERRAWLVAIVVVPLVATALWTRHADAIKAANPLTAWLTSGELKTWNFGTMSQRLSFETWDVIANALVRDVVGVVGLALLAVAAFATARSSQRRFWVGIALAALLPPLVFTNLYWIHDYYLAAITPAVAALIGLGAGHVWRRIPEAPLARGVAVAVGLVLALNVLALDPGYWKLIYGSDPDPAISSFAQEIDDRTRAEDRVAVVGLDWSPAALYYADRWGLMVVDRNDAISYDAIHRDGYRHLFVAGPDDTDLSFLTRWAWVSALGPHMYGIADDPRSLQHSPTLATNVQGEVHPGRLLQPSLTVRCGLPTNVPAGARGTVLVIADPSENAKLSISSELAPLPARELVWVAPRVVDAGRLTLGCSGRGSVRLDVYAAAP